MRSLAKDGKSKVAPPPKCIRISRKDPKEVRKDLDIMELPEVTTPIKLEIEKTTKDYQMQDVKEELE